MPHVDDRVREALHRLEVPVEGGTAFDAVARRRRRLRLRRRLAVATTVAVVVAATVVGTLGLVALVGRSERGGPRHPGPSPTSRITTTPVRLCGVSSAVADVNGDGTDDRIQVGVPLPAGVPSCRGVELSAYVARIELGSPGVGSGPYARPLPECAVPGQCWILATADLDRDGRAEVAIDSVVGASTLNFSLYRFDPAAPDGPLVRLAIAPPGDPFDELYGLAPGAATFTWYGSVTHQHWISCAEAPGLFDLVTALRDPRDPGIQDVHTTVVRIGGGELVVESTRDERVPDGSFDLPADLCGSPLAPMP